MDFNTITLEMEKAAVLKFKEYGRGIVIGKYISGKSDESSWSDLTDFTLFSEHAIKSKMLEIARTINTNCNDEFLGDLETAFTVTDIKDKKIKFSYLDMYCFLRAVIRYRRETAEYKNKKAKAAELTKFLEENKSTEQKLAEATEQLKKLQSELE